MNYQLVNVPVPWFAKIPTNASKLRSRLHFRAYGGNLWFIFRNLWLGMIMMIKIVYVLLFYFEVLYHHVRPYGIYGLKNLA